VGDPSWAAGGVPWWVMRSERRSEQGMIPVSWSGLQLMTSCLCCRNAELMANSLHDAGTVRMMTL
jgi:hypothetical protein